jgi:uncharacterized membrane protein
MIAAIGLQQIAIWILRVTIPIIIFYIVYLILTKAFRYLGFSKIESILIVVISFIFMFPIVFKGFDISNIAIFSYNGWIVGINTGGALIPIILSIYLIYKRSIPLLKVGVGILIVTLITFFVTTPVPSRGIVSYFPYWLLPGIIACVCSIVLLRKDFVKGAPLTYASGTIGVLIGADFLHLYELLSYEPTKLGTMATIGGAVLFDLIFITGILSVIVYGLVMYKYKPANR